MESEMAPEECIATDGLACEGSIASSETTGRALCGQARTLEANRAVLRQKKRAKRVCHR